MTTIQLKEQLVNRSYHQIYLTEQLLLIFTIYDHQTYYYPPISSTLSLQLQKYRKSINSSMNSIKALQDNMRPIQELAFHKQQSEINGVQFYCHESYYEGELLNGIDLQIKEVRGLDNKICLIDYLYETQELIFCASSNLIIYNTHKRTYHQLLPLKGEAIILKTHLQKMNNREYIIWMQKQSSLDQSSSIGKTTKQSIPSAYKLKKQSNNFKQRRQTSNRDGSQLLNGFLSSFLSTQGGNRQTNNLMIIDQHQPNEKEAPKINVLMQKKVRFESQQTYFLRVYDYSRKCMILDYKIQIPSKHVVRNVFMWWNHFKIVGYILEDQEHNCSKILYKKIQKPQSGQSSKSLFNFQLEKKFECLATDKKVEGLQYNNQENNHIFHDSTTINLLKIQERAQNDEVELFHQFFNMQNQNASDFKSIDQPQQKSNGKCYRLIIEQRIEFESNVISITLNDQYLAVLTNQQISFHSAFDVQLLIFVHNLQQISEEPSYIQFNRSNLMMTYRDSSNITSYTTTNKTLSFASKTSLEVNHCKQIMKIYTNHISSEVFCVIMFYEIQSRMSINNAIHSKKTPQSCVEYVIKPAFIDVSASYFTPSLKTEAKILHLSKKSFKKVHTCPWLSSYLLETDEGIQYQQWKETFESKRAIALHPTGIFLVVCFKQTFKIYVSTSEGLINTYRGDSAKDIQACAIAPSGNHLAIASLNTVLIYDFYSCKKIKTIVLPIGVMVEDIHYQNFSLSCLLRNKKIYIFETLDQYKQIIAFNPKSYVNEPVFKGQNIINTLVDYSISQLGTIVSISQIHYDPILNFIIYSYRSTLYFFNCTTNNLFASYEYDPISCIHYNQNLSTLFLGTDNGEVICFAWPNKPSNLLSEQRKFKFHGGSIVDIKVRSDLKELITVGNDQSVCITSLVLVQNLKKFQGLEIIQQLGSHIKICYDILLRRGFYQYTHSKFNDKLQKLKDIEDEVLNINFILPEERIKQKEQMLNNINVNTQELSDKNKVEYSQVQAITCSARDKMSKIREDACKFQSQKEQEKQQLKDQLFSQYIKLYNNTQNTEFQLKIFKSKYQNEIAESKIKFKEQLTQQNRQYDKLYNQILQKYRGMQQNLEQVHMEQLDQIQAQKHQFINQNISSLNEVIGDMNNNNGILSCKNNKIQKEISQLKSKIEQHKYLLQRLQNNTQKIKQEQQLYDKLKHENSKMVEKEDKVNLTQIQKRYVQQTQLLIQKDKQIAIKIVNYNKEKDTLIYLQKCVEQIESNIEVVVENILQQNKQKKQELNKPQQIKAYYDSLSHQILNKKKKIIRNRNQYKNYLGKLQSIFSLLPSKDIVAEILKDQKIMCEPTNQKQDAGLYEKDMLNKIMAAKLCNLKREDSKTSRGDRLRINRTTDNLLKNYRKMKTQAVEDSYIRKERYSPTCAFQSSTCREVVDKKTKRLIYQLGVQEKQYERVKTQQKVFENSRNKFNIQNVDLTENYNALVMENKKIVISLKKQDLLSKATMRTSKGLNKNNSTPFLLYLQNKASTQRALHNTVPPKVYEL